MYEVTSTHSFTDSQMDGQRFGTTAAAWWAVAVDYASADAGLDPEGQDQDTETLAGMVGEGSVTLTTGEVVTVRRV